MVDRLAEIDDAIAVLYEERRDVERAIRAACEHEWGKALLFTGALRCDKCGAEDHDNACVHLDWPKEVLEKWPFDVAPERFCYRHKRAFRECEVALG